MKMYQKNIDDILICSGNKLKQNQLQRYTMTLNIDALPGNANGLLTVQNCYNQYRALDVLTLNGYTSATTYT